MKKFKSNKKVYIIIVSFVLVAIIFSGTFGTYNKYIKKIQPISTVSLSYISENQNYSSVDIISSKGMSASAPNNSLPSLDAAKNNGYTYVSFDIRLTKDNVWVLSNEKRINKMTNGSGKISKMTYYDIEKYDVDNGANYKKYKNIKIASLDSALSQCMTDNITPVINVLDYNEEGLKLLKKQIISNGFEKSAIVICCDSTSAGSLKKSDKNFNVFRLVNKLTQDEMQEALSKKEIGICFKNNTKKNTEEHIKSLSSSKIKLICYDVNEKDDFKYYFDCGIRQFISQKIVP